MPVRAIKNEDEEQGRDEGDDALRAEVSNVLRRSLFTKDTTLRDRLFRLAMIFDDSSIMDFVQSPDDM